jgi:hypothetical protein
MRRSKMDITTEIEKNRGLRKEQRTEVGYPRIYASISRVDDENDINGGLVIDLSSSGVGIITSHPYPVGTEININIDNEFTAIGEVTDVQEAWEEWDWSGMVRMSVYLISKDKWPL